MNAPTLDQLKPEHIAVWSQDRDFFRYAVAAADLLDRWPSMTAASKATGVSLPMISEVVSGKREQAKGIAFARISDFSDRPA